MHTHHLRLASCSRRRFLKATALGAAALAADPAAFFAQAADPARTDVWLLKGPDKTKLMQKCLEIIFAHGGLGVHVDNLTLKVNAAWARTPEQGATTHPDLVEAFLKGCREAGIKRLTIPENPCTSASQSFTRSGILAAAKRCDAQMIDLESSRKHFTDVDIPAGENLKSAAVARQFIEAGALVNMPVAKHHGGATLSMAMKNWMGAVEDRGYWHRNDLHQCIADFASFIRPTWTIVDATRIMLDEGPQGPARTMKQPDLLIVSRDQVAADACTCQLFHDSIEAVGHLVDARRMGLGTTDLKAMNLHRITV